MSKPKVAFFDFASCEGCQLQVANLGEVLVDLFDVIDLVEFREIMTERYNKSYDIVFIEGSIGDHHAEERLKRIRSRSKILVAYGSCAVLGGVNGLKNAFNLEEIRKYVYGDKYRCFDAIPTKAVDEVVNVDYYIPGCPVYLPEVVEVIKSILRGVPYTVCDKPVCWECKLNENVCLYEKGVVCLGPWTKAGCNSWCPNNGNICYGCRGLVSNPARDAALDIIKKYNVNEKIKEIGDDLMKKKFDMYNRAKGGLNGNKG
ncbi:MAG: cytochrome B [Elusimicrobiales bacterium]